MNQLITLLFWFQRFFGFSFLLFTLNPIGLAFYVGDKSDGVPDTEQVDRLYENGIIGTFNFSLGSIKIRAVLDSLLAHLAALDAYREELAALIAEVQEGLAREP